MLPPPRSFASADEPIGVRASGGFAVIDVETTGLDPVNDRIIECAIVTLDPTGAPLEEWSTLLAIPGRRRLGAQHIHGIERRMLEGAPSFAEVSGAIATRISGRVLVGHVLSFDIDNLRAEFARLGATLPDLSGLCTRDLARLCWPDARHHLAACCEYAAISTDHLHSALGDARATATLLRYFLDNKTTVELPEQVAPFCTAFTKSSFVAPRALDARVTAHRSAIGRVVGAARASVETVRQRLLRRGDQ